MTEEKTSEEKYTVNEKNLSKEKLEKVVKSVVKETTEQSISETEEKIYLLGFMPPGEVSGLVVSELGESFNLDRVKKLWLPKSQKANELFVSDSQLLDDEKIRDVVKDIDPKYAEKLETIENQLKSNPFWQANKHVIKMVKIEALITLQNSVNLDRATKLTHKIKKNATIDELLDYTFDFNRKAPEIRSHIISNTAVLFSTTDHDVRPGKIEVRKINRYTENDENGSKIPALVIPIVEGESFIYCIRTWTMAPMSDGTMKKIYFLTLQNGIHRAYALRSLGIEYMPCLIIDPATAGETNILTVNWSPERLQQNVTQRPPLMKDFFNPELTEKFNVPKTMRCIKVEWKIENFTT
ncbi:MAG: hypothetical protein HY222_00685 [Thaumarchaeota archaeon]|nr:hypothetical protein [Nitrososphaerota archaeon]MBI3640901.1 hypothetical protein [Nitrososphaerota archaeon]